MLKKKLFVATIGLGFLFFGNALQANAAAQGNPDDLKIDAKANEEAVKFVKEHGGLEDSPVPAENLTTQQPVETILKNTNQRTTHKFGRSYTINGLYNMEIKCNYLVPTGFDWSDNGIPVYAVGVLGGPASTQGQFSFITSRVSDTGIGGYGTGGWYWRKFYTDDPGRGRVFYWLSAWNWNHLVYG